MPSENARKKVSNEKINRIVTFISYLYLERKVIFHLTSTVLDYLLLKLRKFYIYCSTTQARPEVRQQPARPHHGLRNDLADCAGMP